LGLFRKEPQPISFFIFKGLLHVVKARTNRGAQRSACCRMSSAQRRTAHSLLALEELESRITPTPVTVVDSNPVSISLGGIVGKAVTIRACLQSSSSADPTAGVGTAQLVLQAPGAFYEAVTSYETEEFQVPIVQPGEHLKAYLKGGSTFGGLGGNLFTRWAWSKSCRPPRSKSPTRWMSASTLRSITRRAASSPPDRPCWASKQFR
jgi:hypothetical protein